MNNYMKQRYKGRRSMCFDILGRKCILCGETDESLLQFDHIDRDTKDHSIADMMLWAKNRLLEEIKKCQVLCKSCHIKKTLSDLNQKDARLTHGTISSYRYCKCTVCKEFMSNYNKKKRKERMGS
jgi:5-methylcytosine-specific restriction endonuclease McrA